tara:strand:- start:4339 stop:4821 length:483 start_codon:yes stop_codon:yes gene_type:complete
MSSAPVSLGKGAWCCDTDSEIPPEREAEVFEERATSEILFEGMDTVPPRKDVDHVAVFHEGCRYRVTYSEKETVLQLKKKLWDGGLGRGRRRGIQSGKKDDTPQARTVIPTHTQLKLLFAGRILSDTKTLQEEKVPKGCKSLACLDSLKTKPNKESAYWN